LSTKKIKKIKIILDKTYQLCNIDFTTQNYGKLVAMLSDMNKIITTGIYLRKHKKSMMMCCMAMRYILGMGGPPM
jgi:hypothetical protein